MALRLPIAQLCALGSFLFFNKKTIIMQGGGKVEAGRFIVCGEDKKSLSVVKNALSSGGHIFTGYAKDPSTILRHVRSQNPDLIIIDVPKNINEIIQSLKVIDEELLSACILLLDFRNDDIFHFLSRTKAMTYIAKPVFEEVVIQIADMAIMNFWRVQEYENKVQKLNDTLESRKAVEKAKWILVDQEGISENEAYEIIKKKSRDNRITMKEIAEAIIITRG